MSHNITIYHTNIPYLYIFSRTVFIFACVNKSNFRGLKYKNIPYLYTLAIPYLYCMSQQEHLSEHQNYKNIPYPLYL